MTAIRVISKFVGQNRPFINTPFLNYIDYINKQMKMNKNQSNLLFNKNFRICYLK